MARAQRAGDLALALLFAPVASALAEDSDVPPFTAS